MEALRRPMSANRFARPVRWSCSAWCASTRLDRFELCQVPRRHDHTGHHAVGRKLWHHPRVPPDGLSPDLRRELDLARLFGFDDLLQCRKEQGEYFRRALQLLVRPAHDLVRQWSPTARRPSRSPSRSAGPGCSRR